jgi:sterol desaturase/sphingolipid hydroxylase (fatty acid hydroxylase superfamily)
LWFRPYRAANERPEYLLDIACFMLSAVMLYVVDIEIGARAWNSAEPLIDPRVLSVIAMIGAWPLAVRVIATLVIADFAFYWTHRLNHVSFLWHAHALHHAPRNLNWLSGYRSTFVHILLMELGYVVVGWFIPLPDGALLALVYFYVVNNQVIHSRVRLPWGPLRHILVTPEFHYAHHVADLTTGNTNFGGAFSVWDRLFGTYTPPSSVPADARTGLTYHVSLPRLFLGIAPRKLEGAPGEW